MKRVAFSDRLNRIVAEEAVLEQIAAGLIFTEGPVWNPEQGSLIFSDIPANAIYQWHPDKGVSIYRSPSGNSNGLTRDLEGRLLACEHGNRRVSRQEADGTVKTIAAHYLEKRLNSPNDIVVKSDGSLYFTDPPYGLSDPSEQEQPVQGVYRLVPETGELTLLAEDFDRPNGLAFSPDEQVLYIDDSARQHVRAFDVTSSGTLENGRLFAELDPGIGAGVPDGLKVDTAGHVYVTGPGGIWIFSPAGEKLGVLLVPEIAANLAWGEADGKTLFITASTSVYRVQTEIGGRVPGKR